MNTKKHKYITTLQGKPTIFKYINGKNTYYGKYETIEDAIKYRNILIAKNWDKTLFKKLYYLYKQEQLKNTDRYIIKNNEKYTIRRIVDGHVKTYGTYTKKEYAIEERNLLIDCNWDLMTYYESY